MSDAKKRGGWSNPASAENGKRGGRRRKQLREVAGEPAFVLRDGDRIGVLDGAGLTLATVTLVAGACRLTNEDGRVLTLVVSE